jgi:hypothetical protein
VSACRAVQRSLHKPVCCEEIEATDGVSVAGVGHVGDLVGAEDIAGEAADAGHDAGVFAHPAGVFGHGGVAGVVQAILDVPVVTDGVGSERCGDLDVGDEIGGLAGVFPMAGFCAALQAVALDTDDALDGALPVAAGEQIAWCKDRCRALLVA